MFVAILDAEPDGHVAKSAIFPTLALAEDHVARFLSSFPNAFATDLPGGPIHRWKIDFVLKVITLFSPISEARVELPVIKAVRALADRMGPMAVADIEVFLGPAP